MNHPFTFFNGEMMPAEQPVIDISNRAFRYGDGLFESMVWTGGTVQHWVFHAERLQEGCQLLGLDAPSINRMQSAIRMLAEANALAGIKARMGIQVWRIGEGNYSPGGSQSAFLVKSAPLEAKYLNPMPVALSIYHELKKPVNPLSGIKTLNALLYVMAGRHALHTGVDDCVLLNEHGRVCETISSNIFWVKGREVFTPALSEGCIAGVMRRYVCQCITGSGYQLTEGCFEPQHLDTAEHIFLSNAVAGVVPAGSFRGKRLNDGVPAFGHEM